MNENDLHILQDIKKRLEDGANNPNLKTASLLLDKEEVMLLYGLCGATIDYYEMTKQKHRPLRRTKPVKR
jgi:hypothetical protein